MKKIITFSLFLFVALTLSAQDRRELHILSINDPHAAIEQFPRLGYIADSLRALYPDLLILTNKEPESVVYTNIPYLVESSRRIERITTPRQVTKHVTNDLLSTTLSSGFKTNSVSCLFAPGDFIYASGTAFNGGKVQLIISR